MILRLYSHKYTPSYYYFPIIAAIASPILAGFYTTAIPFFSKALILSVAVPFPPDIIAPA